MTKPIVPKLSPALLIIWWYPRFVIWGYLVIQGGAWQSVLWWYWGIGGAAAAAAGEGGAYNSRHAAHQQLDMAGPAPGWQGLLGIVNLLHLEDIKLEILTRSDINVWLFLAFVSLFLWLKTQDLRVICNLYFIRRHILGYFYHFIQENFHKSIWPTGWMNPISTSLLFS